MPSVALIVFDSLIKVLGSFALGYATRDFVGKRAAVKAKPKAPVTAKKPAVVTTRPKEELKMVLCVNESLRMGKGKIGAQCAHAAVGVYQQYRSSNQALFKQWEWCGQPKIALRLNDDSELQQLAQKAEAAGLFTYTVCDAGRTQIPAGSQTVLAIGPAPKSKVDEVTGHLKLL